MRRKTKIGIAIPVVLAILVIVRLALEPEEVPPPALPANLAAIVRPEMLEPYRVGVPSFAQEMAEKRVVLVGETHFVNETMAFVIDLMSQLDGRRIHLLLELPGDAQDEIDEYLATGDDAVLRGIFARASALPYAQLLEWAHAHRDKVVRVVAMDEPRWRVVLMRALLTDTRNRTMAEAIHREYRDAGDGVIIAFGGQMHMMMAGRYRYDTADREPAGSRLSKMGVPRTEIASVMLAGKGRFPLDFVLRTPGIVRMAGDAAAMPFAYFLPDAIFGVRTAGELCDFFVDLGPLSPVAESH